MPGCKDWKKNIGVNPFSGRQLQKDSKLYKQFDELCSKKNKVCKDYNKNKEINPLTNRTIKDNSKIHQLIQKLCMKTEIKKAKEKADQGKQKKIERAFVTPLQCTEYKTIKLRDHQKHLCNYLERHKLKGLVLFHSVGSGKTITAITVIRCLLQKYPEKKVYVVTPTSLVDNFYKELNKLEINFDDNLNLYSHGQFIKKINKDGAKFCEDSIIIVDEAHHFKTEIKKEDGKMAKTLMRATKKASHVFLLTATPVQNNPIEFANLYAMVSKKEDQINELYKIFKNGPRSKILSLLDKKISYYKNESLDHYPSVTYTTIDFRMTPEYYKLYKEVEENNSDIFKHVYNTKDMRIFLNGIRRAVNTLDGKITTPKIEWALKHIKSQIKKGNKVLIYSNWLKAGLELIQERLNNSNIEWVEVNGKMTKLQRTRSVNKYNRDEVLVLFVSSAGAEGLDLKGTRSIVVLEPHWNYEKISQVVGRGVRFGSHDHLSPSKRHVDIYNLILKKPKNNSDKLESADDILIEMSDDKEEKILEFYNILIEASI